MKPDGLSCGRRLSSTQLGDVRRRAVLESKKWNLDDEGRSKLCDFPLVLGRSLFGELSSLAVALDREARAAERELLGRPRVQAVLGLPWRMRLALLRADATERARYARYDFHPTAEGTWRITEGNVDVAGGWNEASLATSFARHSVGAVAGPDPAAALARAISAQVRPGARVGCLHATRYTDDHQVAALVARHLADLGLTPVHVAPTQLACRRDGAVARLLSDVELDAVFRFFPCDWLVDAPLATRWWRACRPGTTVWVNPLSAVLTQSKRFPLAWPHLRAPLTTWKRLLPETRVPTRSPPAGDWVTKPAFGHEGWRVGLEGVTDPARFESIRRDARHRPNRWVEQRRFAAASMDTPDGPLFPCVGVFVIDGQAAGLYGRLAERPLVDDRARDAVILIDQERP